MCVCVCVFVCVFVCVVPDVRNRQGVTKKCVVCGYMCMYVHVGAM